MTLPVDIKGIRSLPNLEDVDVQVQFIGDEPYLTCKYQDKLLRVKISSEDWEQISEYGDKALAKDYIKTIMQSMYKHNMVKYNFVGT